MYAAIERRVSPAARLLLVQMFRFGVVGTSGFLIDTAVVYALRSVLGLYVVRLVSFMVAATANWALHRVWTFRGASTKPAHEQWLHFLAANALGATLNIGTYVLLVRFSPLCAQQPVFAVAAGSIAGMGVNFVLSSQTGVSMRRGGAGAAVHGRRARDDARDDARAGAGAGDRRPGGGLHRRRGAPAGRRARLADHPAAAQQFLGASRHHRGPRAAGARGAGGGLPDLYMGDISDPRGGPLRGGHFSHQMGVDADVWLDLTPPHPRLLSAARDELLPPSMVAGMAVDPAHWGPPQATMLRLATGLPHVDRVLVNPVIKRELCRTVTGDRAWLRMIRPWWGHASHMHIHFACPAGQPLCHNDVPPIPAGDGCDASLDWWFAQMAAPPKPPKPPDQPAPPTPLPAACRAVFAAP